MEDLVNKIKQKLSVDNIVEMIKETFTNDDNRNKEEDVLKTEKTDVPTNLINVEELSSKINDVTEDVAAKTTKVIAVASSKAVTEKLKSSMFSVLKKGESIEKHGTDEEDAFKIKDNISGFFD